MHTSLKILLATAAVSLAIPAYAANESAEVESKVDYKKDGGYESSRTSEHTTTGGTKTTSESTVDVDVDSKGRIDKTVKSEVVNDPKGLMNKEKELSETKIDEKARGGYKQTTTRKSKDADGTNITYKTVTDVDVDADGNVTTTATTEKTVDPKGLMNETTTKSKTKSINGKVVEQTTKAK